MFAHLQRALKRYHSMKRIEWVMHGDETPSDMAQVILLVSSMTFASGVEVNALAALARGESKALRKYGETQQQNLGDLVQMTRTVLSKGQRTRVMCMITLDAHNRDVVQNMIRTGVQIASHFLWQSLLKLCFCVPEREFLDRDPELREGGKRAECQILNAVLPYDYEYLGNGPRLVITPLTDRIYVTATQALNLKMGCAPAGPAGTGKTETTKDLAAALGKVCYVVNCSPEMDFKSMGNIFKGLASSGSWGCFDEFNRLIPEVLSVCSVQYKAICDGCRGSFGTIIVDGDKIALDPTVGAFITMNPGYLGRSTLPEGLKALFRPMTVMVPDLVLICENMLMAEGFEGAKALASKFYALYSLLAQLLSKQRHYDWGLRAVKSVLVVAGGFKRAEPAVPENHLLMRALRDFNTPKIVADDEVIFHGLLEDLFPGANPPRAIDQQLEGAVADACKVLGNDPDDLFRLKVVQFEELTQVRHCVFIMGPAGAGKSQVWRTLAKARELLSPERRTKFVDLNPKALSTKELYGYMVLATREWKDGLLSKQMRDLGEIADEKPKWLVLDGDLDANWIESMNSVMDDNRMLTLVSGERIPLKSHMKMIFEIRDLAHATPATVSRAGVLYISTAVGSQWRSLVRSWVSNQTRAHEVKLYLQSLFDKYLPPSLLFYRAQLKPVVPLEDLHMVDSLLCMLDGLLSRAGAKSRLSGSDWQSTLHKLFVFGCCWALGCGLSVSDDGVDQAKLFSDWWRQNWRSSGDIKLGGNANKNITEYFLDLDSTGGGPLKFEPWSKNKEFFYSIRFDSKASNMSSVMVPTTETCSAAFWMDLLIKQHKPVMLAGAAGTGKTQLLSGVLQRLGKVWTSSLVNFNFYTTSEGTCTPHAGRSVALPFSCVSHPPLYCRYNHSVPKLA
jgi:dynein heavy chain, axonemal